MAANKLELPPRKSGPLAGPSKTMPPDSEQVRRQLRRSHEQDPERLTLETIGHSGEGRPIDAATLTDPTVDDAAKQCVLILAGQHGNEESARRVALSLIDALLDQRHRETLRRQRIVVVPNVNPDGTDNNTYATPDGVRPNMDHGPDGPTIPEARAVQQIAHALMPDVFVDVHARGHAGCSYDMVLYPQTKSYTEDDNLFHAIAADMAVAGEAAGLPHITHPLTWWTPPPENTSSTTVFAYEQFKSIVMLTESTEHDEVHYPRELTAAVGVARLEALLAWGNGHHPKLPYAGYPNQLVLGMFSRGVIATGATAAARRSSRVNIWRQRAHFHRIKADLPEQAMRKTVVTEYDGPPLEQGCGFMIRAAGLHDVASVQWSGRSLPRHETDGYIVYHDALSTYVIAAAPVLTPGTHSIEIELS
ncbi:MAG: M14 family zinc carboxypeptidase [Phycisphaeraceae bacterium]